jgi:hypothetical protein
MCKLHLFNIFQNDNRPKTKRKEVWFSQNKHRMVHTQPHEFAFVYFMQIKLRTTKYLYSDTAQYTI